MRYFLLCIALTAGCLGDQSPMHVRNCSGETYNRRLLETIRRAHDRGETCAEALADVAVLEAECKVKGPGLNCPTVQK